VPSRTDIEMMCRFGVAPQEEDEAAKPDAEADPEAAEQ